jgi:serine/threonine-protein kinase
MRGWDSVTQGGSLRPGPSALVIALGGLLLSLAPVSQRLEGAFFDAIQRLQDRTARPDIVLVDTRTMRGGATSAWESESFPALLDALGRSGVRLVIPAEVPPPTSGLPDTRQLATLAEMEKRSRATGNKDAAASIAAQWAEITRRSDLHARTIAATNRLRNVIVAVPTFEGAPGSSATGTGCESHVMTAVLAPSTEDSGARRVRAAAPPPASLCTVILGSGHVEFWSDPDGVVRRLDLLVNASGTLVPAAALRAAIALSFPSGTPPEIGSGEITWDSSRVRTSGGPQMLMRFYSAREPGRAFTTITAEEVLRGAGSDLLLKGQIAVLGDVSAGNGQGYVTPVGPQMPATLLLATGLSNLLADDYLVRPAWSGWAELVLMGILGVAVLLWGPRLPHTVAAMTGLLVATCLLGLEAYTASLGIWIQLATVSGFVLYALGAVRILQPGQAAHRTAPVDDAVAKADAPARAPATAVPSTGDQLDLAFSMLRHQPPTEHVKQRLYDVALEHARQRDLAKAERVLRHLAGIDPHYRNAGEKLKKLAGLRVAAPPAAGGHADAPPVVQAAPRPLDKDDLSGQTIGRYRIEKPIGRGAMATVYLGLDPKINRRVAVKTLALAEEFGDTDLANARAQFLREAESAGRLNHPNIISIYDAGEDGRVAYLAMEYFSGKPLSFYAQQGQLLEPRLVLDIMARAAEALHYAHNQHVVHRDVKPANLLYDAATDTLKITDFGIARLTDSSRTKTGIILGTPSYMSPEQLAGSGVSGQSDLFSLGITLYQLLTGAPPFRADSIPKLMQKIAQERHQPVSAMRDDLPPGLDEVLKRALAKNPAARYPNGRAMALALRDCCSSFAFSAAVQPT